MKATGKNLILNREFIIAPQQSSLLVSLEPEVKWTVDSVGSKVEEEIAVGDRVLLPPGKPVEIAPGKFLVAASLVLAIYTK